MLESRQKIVTHSKSHIKKKKKSLSNEDFLYIDKMCSKGIKLVNKGQYQNAIKLFNRLLLKHPGQYVALVTRGSAYSLMKHDDLAIKDFTKAITYTPEFAEAYKRRGIIKASSLNDYTGALDDLTLAAEKQGATHDIYLQRAYVRSNIDDIRSALHDVNRAIKGDDDIKSKNGDARRLKGQLLARLGESKKAILSYKKALAMNPKLIEVYIDLGDASMQYGNHLESIKYIQKAITMDKNYIQGYMQAAIYTYQGGLYCSSIEFSEKCISLAQKHFSSYDYYYYECVHINGMAYHSSGRILKAIEMYDKILQDKSNDMVFYHVQI